MMNCTACNGNGEIDCPDCGGQVRGKADQETCHRCGGRAVVECHRCSGSGYLEIIH